MFSTARGRERCTCAFTFFFMSTIFFCVCFCIARNNQMVVVFRGTQTTKEWTEDASVVMELLDGETPESGIALLWNRQVIK